MMFKTILLIACAVVVQAGLLPESPEQPYESHPSYSFSYDVHDSNTGDIKSQSETRDGDNVQGRYSLNDPDGYRRTVEYSSNGADGFQASVRRELIDAPQLVKVAAPIIKEAAPIKIEQPKYHFVQQAPVLRTYAAPSHQIIHHTPTFVHSAAPAYIQSHPAVHLGPAVVKSAPGQVYTHHPAAVVKTTLSAPHVSFVY